MAVEEIPDLWGPITVGVVSPVAILRNQAGRLRDHTKGMLKADVLTAIGNKDVIHTFQIVAPSLNGYKFDLFTASHDSDFVFPVRVKFKPWEAVSEKPSQESLAMTTPIAYTVGRLIELARGESGVRQCDTPASLLDAVKDVLTSGYTQSVINSLLAKSNDVPKSG